MMVLQRSHGHVGPRMLCGHKSSSSEHWQQLGTAMIDYLLLNVFSGRVAENDT
jgi:hypothetical protein